MKFTISGAAVASVLFAANPVFAAWKGFNLGANNADGSCKGVADYTADFKKIQSWPGGFNAVRLYSAADCNTLDNAVPAAKNTGMKILVGLWASDDKFQNELNTLIRLITSNQAPWIYGTDWIAAVSVGSEDLYRSSTDASQHINPSDLANKINNARTSVRNTGVAGASSIKFGHTDTWTMWVQSSNDVVTQACEIVITDGYPFWQGVASAGGPAAFYQSLNDVKSHVQAVKPGALVWVGETGYPTGGKNFGNAYPGTTAASQYWKNVACKMQRDNQDFFWYSAFDAPTATDKYNVESHFGVAYPGRTPKFNLQC